MSAEQPDPLRLFISHSSHDEQLVIELLRLIQTSLGLRSAEIRCTSVNGFRMVSGANIDEQLRNEVHEAIAFVGVISMNSLKSMYVSFELGARWGAGKHLIPILAPGIAPNLLAGPLKGLTSLRCDDAGQLHQLIQDLGKELEIPPEPPASIQVYIDKIRQMSASDAQGQSEALTDPSRFEIKDGIAYLQKSDGSFDETPFCPNCQAVMGTTIRKSYVCPKCDYSHRVQMLPEVVARALNSTPPEATEKPLNPDQETILKHLAQCDYAKEDEISANTGIGKQTVKLHLSDLLEIELVESFDGYLDVCWRLSDIGRKRMHELGLLK